MIFFFCFRDRFRTAINVMGDAFGAGIVNHRSQKELNEIKKDSPRPSVGEKITTIDPEKANHISQEKSE